MQKLTNFKLVLMFFIVAGIVSLSLSQGKIDNNKRIPLSTKVK